MTGVILAGGEARRFGGAPKGLARVGGVRVVDRVAVALAAGCDRLLLVANAPDAAAWLPGVLVAAAGVPGLGSLGGLHAALARAAGPVVVVAWDMPFVPASLVRALREAGAGGAAAVVPEGEAGPEPLCAYYAAACLGVAERLLGAGERRARALGAAADAVRLSCAEVARHGDPALIFRSVNTPEDLAAAEAVANAREAQP